MEKEFKKRIGFKGNLNEISNVVCKGFGLGKFVSNKLITTGYEDFNFALKTAKGKFFVKVFANNRTLSECKRYSGLIEKALANGVNAPCLLKSRQGYLNIANVGEKKLRIVVMEFIDGKTLLEAKKSLGKKEILVMAKQAALINTMKIRPKPVYDSWAATNFLKEFEKTKRFLASGDLKLVLPLVKDFKELGINSLPHCFVHGDLIKTNIMKDKNGKLWIIDFSVSNYYPRIQELAVMASNALFEAKNKAKTGKNLAIALKEYQKTIPLRPKELEALPTYIRLAHAMHIIGATYAKHKKGNNSRENNYWLKQGRNGLLQSKGQGLNLQMKNRK
jgi:Ser/Thr protein kinase RdoA (MazF antagonist)